MGMTPGTAPGPGPLEIRLFFKIFLRSTLDEYYGLKESDKTDAVDTALQKRQIDRLRFEFLQVYDVSGIKALFSITPFVFRNFTITGVGHEPALLDLTTDEYFKKIIDSIKSEPIQNEYKDIICKNVRLIQYYDKDVMLLKIISTGTPAIYDGKIPKITRKRNKPQDVGVRELSAYPR